MAVQEVRDVLREHVFDQMPIHLLKLPEMQLVERRDVYQHLWPKMDDITEEWIADREKVDWTASRKKIIQEGVRERARYAILSHTWLDDNLEVTYEDLKEGRNRAGPGYAKLEIFCQVAAEDLGVDLAWMDTVCINKNSTTELDESIRSMFRWYQGSFVCIIYLANTINLADLPSDRWCTRGWTLQELLAPGRLKFYNKLWAPLTSEPNDKPSGGVQLPIHEAIENATHIAPHELQHFKPGIDNIAIRMVWAANRMTTRGEDRAYSLMGIFSVSFTIAYGEGAERAFFRLIEAILHSFRNVLGILNWAGLPISKDIHSSNMIPSSPECYLGHKELRMMGIALVPSKPMMLTHLGMRIRLLLVEVDTPPSSPGHRESLLRNNQVQLRCNSSIQEDPTTVELYYVHDRDLFGPFRGVFKFFFGIWNFSENGQHQHLPETCAALLFRVPSAPRSVDSDDDLDIDEGLHDLSSCKVDTKQVIAFTSSKKIRHLKPGDSLKNYGIKLYSVYL